MTAPYADLSRPPLSAAALSAALAPDGFWRRVDVVPSTGSTNADLAVRALGGEPEGALLLAEHQTGGRGRLDRRWVSPPRAGLTLSMLLRPAAVPTERRGWLPLLVGLALAETVTRIGKIPAYLKWPNDLLLGAERGKAAGVLAQVVGDAVVVGVGMNVTTRADELPTGEATSLVIAGSSCTDRGPLVRALARGVAGWYGALREAAGDARSCGLWAAYLRYCETIGQQLTVTRPGQDPLAGRAIGVDDGGRLLLRVGAGQHTMLASGDITHLRPVERTQRR